MNLKFSKSKLFDNLEALELARLFLGQGKYLLEYLDKTLSKYSWEEKVSFDCEYKKLIFPELLPMSYHSICSSNVSEKAKICFDMFDTVRHALSWDKEGKDPDKDKRDWSSMIYVSFDAPMYLCKKFNMIELKKINDKYWSLFFPSNEQFEIFCECLSLGRELRKGEFKSLPNFLEIENSQLSFDLIGLCKQFYKG